MCIRDRPRMHPCKGWVVVEAAEDSSWHGCCRGCARGGLIAPSIQRAVFYPTAGAHPHLRGDRPSSATRCAARGPAPAN
eukprot:1882959-Pyramimonas_sp.AAC.1